MSRTRRSPRASFGASEQNPALAPCGASGAWPLRHLGDESQGIDRVAATGAEFLVDAGPAEVDRALRHGPAHRLRRQAGAVLQQQRDHAGNVRRRHRGTRLDVVRLAGRGGEDVDAGGGKSNVLALVGALVEAVLGVGGSDGNDARVGGGIGRRRRLAAIAGGGHEDDVARSRGGDGATALARATLGDSERRQNTVMPITAYAGMTREDLAAIYAFLRSQKPVVNRVNRFPDAPTTK